MSDIEITLTYAEEEAREVARAIRYFTSNVSATRDDHDRMALIRSAIKGALPSPKPDEPTGLGAVVEDAAGDRWVFGGLGEEADHNDEYPWWSARLGWAQYGDVDAVRVLSEGVTS